MIREKSRSETTVTIKDGSLTESEPNNRPEEANRIGLNSTIKGSLIGGTTLMFIHLM